MYYTCYESLSISIYISYFNLVRGSLATDDYSLGNSSPRR